MYKLLVVDDEPRQVRSLANIISQLRPDYKIFSAYDGQEAFEFISENHIDILITDIAMPNMDGLQLIERIFNRGIPLKILILSGYSEFEYAQKAIRFGVNDYIVKPISKGNLEETLLKVEKSIQEERDKEYQNERLKQKLDSSLPVYLEHLLNQWVTGSLSESGKNEIEAIFPFKGQGTVLLSSFSKLRQLQGDLNAEMIQYAKFSIKEALNPIGHTISFLLEGDCSMMATILNTNQPFNLVSLDNVKRLNGYIKSIRNEFDIAVTVGVAENSTNIFDGIEEFFQKARLAVEHKFFSGLEKVIFYSELEGKQNLKQLNTGMFEAELTEAVRGLDKTRAAKAVSEFFESINDKYLVHPHLLKDSILYVLVNQVKAAGNLMADGSLNILAEDVKQKTSQCEDYKELWHYTGQVLYEIIDVLGNSMSDKTGVIINKARKYIDENYAEDITLEAVAQKFHFNPSYFSNLFKSNTGLGFTEYLLKVRIKTAKSLLKSTEYSMADIAGKVGFKDPAYFNKLFKRETGISPLKYRQMAEK